MNDTNINAFILLDKSSIQINKIPYYSLIRTGDKLLIDVKLSKTLLKGNVDSESYLQKKTILIQKTWIENKTVFKVKGKKEVNLNIKIWNNIVIRFFALTFFN